MQPKADRAVTRTTDDKGKRIALVPLTRSGRPAVIFEEDYDMLVAMGVSPLWHHNSNGKGLSYVRARIPYQERTLFTVARLVLGVGKRKVVKHRNGDRLDLRRPNLYVEAGSKAKDGPDLHGAA